MSGMKTLLAASCAALSIWAATPKAAQAQLAVSATPAGSPVLGATIRGSSTTVFSISTAGAVTRTSGNAIRLGPGVVTTPTVTVTCGFLNLPSLCALRPIRVTITPLPDGGPASIIRLRVTGVSGFSYRSGSPPAEASTIVFDMNPIGVFGSAVFRLGMDIQLAGGAASGQYPTSYSITVQFV